MFVPTILVVDDDVITLRMLKSQLNNLGYSVICASSGSEALDILHQQPLDLIVTDLVTPGMNGIELIQHTRNQYDKIPIIIITAHGSIESVVEAMRHGAYDYLEKPCDPLKIRLAVQRALDYNHVVNEYKRIRGLLREQYTFQSIVTVVPDMKEMLERAAKVTSAGRRTPVIIYGESGTGKEVLARAIHFADNGLPSSFAALNCAATYEQLLERELFGHVKGAFPGAVNEREGKLSLASKGTLLLDEICDMPLPLQTKVLRVFNEHIFEKVGSNTPIPANCRIITTCNRNLADMVANRHFNEDLYHRINVYPLYIPPLRNRIGDIPLLCDQIIGQLHKPVGKEFTGISKNAIETMQNYGWPGNVRELRNRLERAVILADGKLIQPSHLGIDTGALPNLKDTSPKKSGMVMYNLSLPEEQLSLDALTENILAITLDRCNGNKSKASQLLKIGRKYFYRH
jgi:DNA-binding NtrC family response regulator